MITERDEWLGVELRHFATLQAIAAEGSFRRAAEHLGYTQSAVSQQLAALERIVGARLVERPGGPRQVSLTEAGDLLLRHADAILARLHAAQADLGALNEGQAGCLRVGSYQSVSQAVLPALIRQFALDWPGVELRLTEAPTDNDLLPGVESGELDLSFGMLPLLPGPFAAEELMLDPYVLAVPADSTLAAGERIPSLRDIAGLPLLGFRRCRTTLQVDQYLRSVTGIEPRYVFRSDDNGTMLAMVGAGLGVAVVPQLVIKGADERVRVLGPIDEVPPRRLCLVWHRDRYQSPAARAFVAAARESFATLTSDTALSVAS